MKTIVLALAAAAIIANLASCNRGHNEASVQPGAADSMQTVPAAKVERADLTGEIALTAEFAPFQEVDVMAKVAGYVRAITVDIGDRVKEGQVLATLEIPEMEDEQAKAEASVMQAEAEVAAANHELHRAGAAYDLAHLSWRRIQDVAKREPGLVPQQELDEFRSRHLVAEAQAAGAKSRLAAAEQRTRVARAEVARLRTMYKYTTITAPFAGVITKRFANNGAMVQAGTASQSQAMPVVRISQNNLLRLVLPVPESAVPQVRLGEHVDVNVPSLSRKFPGRVARVAGKLQMSTRTMDTEIDVPNPDLTLVPGMYARVDLRIAQHDRALVVPLDALDRSGSALRVFAVDATGVLRAVPVTVGMETAQRLEIRTGLQEGDLVVVGRHAGLKEGDKVQTKITEQGK
jgi:RND family efflux transporter MFP subunit